MMFHRIISVFAALAFAYIATAQAQQQVPMYQPGVTAQTSGTQMDSRWLAAATLQLKILMDNSAPNIAASIQGITHPSGNSAYLMSYNVLNLGDHIMVQINVGWKGGFLGNAYQTSVSWELAQSGYMSAQVLGDTAAIAIEPANKQALDNYFRQSVYPVFFSNMEGVGNTWK